VINKTVVFDTSCRLISRLSSRYFCLLCCTYFVYFCKRRLSGGTLHSSALLFATDLSRKQYD